MKKISLQKKLNASAFAFVVALSATSYSHAHGNVAGESYVGLDAVYNFMGFKSGYGDNMFKKSAPGLNLFVGHMFHENFGAEAGFEYDKNVKRSNTAGPGSRVCGASISGNTISYDSKLKQSNPYVGLVGKYNVFDNTSVALMVGGSLSHVNAKYTITSNTLNIAGVNGTATTFSKTRLLPVVRGSVEHKVTDRFGLRALVTWRNTSAIKMTAKETNLQQVKLKDTFSLGIGALYYF
jgi:hypothetical protein